MRSRSAGPRRHLTKEQDEQRLRGLRALARLIVRAHLAAVAGGEASPNGARPEADPEPTPEEDRHAE